MHSIPALVQFEHGFRLLQRTFLRRQVVQLRGLSGGGLVAVEVEAWGGTDGLVGSG